MLGASGLGTVLGNPVGGYLADKIGRRWTIVLSAVPTAGLTAMVPSLGPLPSFVVVVGLIGVTSQVYRPAAAAVLIDSVTTDQQRLAAFADVPVRDEHRRSPWAAASAVCWPAPPT